MNNTLIWQFIKGKLTEGEKVILISVLNSKGGSPGKAGFKLAVTNNELVGTVGGGVMEFNLINEAREWLKQKLQVREIRKLYHNKNTEKAQSGLICTGHQTICIYSLSKNETETVSRICTLTEKNIPFTLLASADKFEIKDEISDGIKIVSPAKNEWFYTEEIKAGDIIYIAGGGHVGKAVAAVMRTLDFRIRILDYRPEIIGGLDGFLQEEKILTPFEKAGEFIEEGKNVYVVILTSSYLTDKAVLGQVLSKKLKYVGMMGSKAKIKRVYEELKAEGVNPELFNKVYAPVGIEIKSLTAAEIAISIAAEIIKVKNSAY